MADDAAHALIHQLLRHQCGLSGQALVIFDSIAQRTACRQSGHARH
jgi:hypothetical protein